jgi:hypothetical protein
MGEQSKFPQKSVHWRMMSTVLFFEDALGFVSAIFYTRIENCPSRMNSGLEIAFSLMRADSKKQKL